MAIVRHRTQLETNKLTIVRARMNRRPAEHRLPIAFLFSGSRENGYHSLFADFPSHHTADIYIDSLKIFKFYIRLDSGFVSITV